jgi:hypothetical protein
MCRETSTTPKGSRMRIKGARPVVLRDRWHSHDDNSVELLKEALGVEKLDTVMIESVEEYEKLMRGPATEIRYVHVRLTWVWVAIAALFLFTILGRDGVPIWDIHHYVFVRDFHHLLRVH